MIVILFSGVSLDELKRFIQTGLSVICRSDLDSSTPLFLAIKSYPFRNGRTSMFTKGNVSKNDHKTHLFSFFSAS